MRIYNVGYLFMLIGSFLAIYEYGSIVGGIALSLAIGIYLTVKGFYIEHVEKQVNVYNLLKDPNKPELKISVR